MSSLPARVSRGRNPVFLIVGVVVVVAVLFGIGLFSARQVAHPRKFSSSARVMVMPLPAGGLNPAIQAQAFKSMTDVELRLPKAGNGVVVIAFAATAEEAEAKAGAALNAFQRTVGEVYGIGVRAITVQMPEKARMTTIFDR